MKISVGVREENELAARRARPWTREKPTGGDAPSAPDGLGGNG